VRDAGRRLSTHSRLCGDAPIGLRLVTIYAPIVSFFAVLHTMDKHKERYSNAFTATLSGILDLFRKQKNVVMLKDEDRLDGKNIMIY